MDDGATVVVIPVLVTTELVVLAVVDAVVLVPSVVDELVVVMEEAESEVVSTNGVVTGALVVTTAGGVVTGANSVVVAYADEAGSVVTVISVIGSARAGTIPPESAVNEIAHPDASTIAAPRPEQIRRGALIAAQLLSTLIGVAVRPTPRLPPCPLAAADDPTSFCSNTHTAVAQQITHPMLTACFFTVPPKTPFRLAPSPQHPAHHAGRHE